MKKSIYALGLLALTTVTSCTDNTYDLSKDNVDWSMQTSGDVLWLPDGSTAATGCTTHCFVGRDFKPLSLKRKSPAYYERLKAHVSD